MFAKRLLWILTALLVTCFISVSAWLLPVMAEDAAPPVTPLAPPPLARTPGPVSRGVLAPISPFGIPVDAAALTETQTITAAPVVLPTPTLSLDVLLVPTPTPTRPLSPTATADVVLLPTPTPAPTAAAVVTPVVTGTLAATPTAPLTGTLSVTETAVITPGAAITSTASVTPTTPLTGTLPITGTAGITPSPANTPTQPTLPATSGLPPAYIAHGTYASTTVYTDATTSQQQGTFTITQAVADNGFGFDQQITLATRRLDGQEDVIRVFLTGEYIVVDYGNGRSWAIVRRRDGSGLVRAVQPITDLAMLFPRVVEQAELIGPEKVGGQDTLHYRMQGQSAVGARLVQPLLGIAGDFRALQLDAWIAIPGGYVLRYSFQVDLEGARVLNAARQEVRADQAVTWTYQLTPVEEPLRVLWPVEAPRPDAWPVAGFAPGTFPTPAGAEFVSYVEEVVELTAPGAMGTVADFYRGELAKLGWSVAGEASLLRAAKDGGSLELLLTETPDGEGTTVTIIPASPPGE